MSSKKGNKATKKPHNINANVRFCTVGLQTPYTRQSFISLFNSIAPHQHRFTVFSDFVIISAISLHNAVAFNQQLEDEYFQIIKKYRDDEVKKKFPELLAILIQLLDVEPYDMLGALYMELELSNTHNGQFFTPHEISLLLAKLSYGDAFHRLETKPFITLGEPACGAGGMVLAFVNEMIKQGYDPARKLFVQCIDIDRMACMMCYLQLSLWNIPAEIIVGNTLTMDFKEYLYTPAFYLNGWMAKLQTQRAIKAVDELIGSFAPVENVVATQSKVDDDDPFFSAIKPEKQKPISTHKKGDSKKGLADHQVDMFDFKIDHEP